MTCRNGSHYECAKCGWSSTCEERKGLLVGQLVRSVLRWEKLDDDVKQNGWDSVNSGNWNYERNKMVRLAHELKEIKI